MPKQDNLALKAAPDSPPTAIQPRHEQSPASSSADDTSELSIASRASKAWQGRKLVVANGMSRICTISCCITC